MSTTVRIDRYVVDVLMRDIVGHDARPSAYVIYLYFATRSRRATALSHAELASATGLSKRGVQLGIAWLKRRGLIDARREKPTAVPFYRVLKPWRHKPRR
ncbi:MAG: helix-turn-helix domain-containing protein [Candidatus Aquilonibacter sp.]|jgi:DNA-binding transcriptional ArsR family regulator